MMKMAGRAMICCVALLLIPTTVSAAQRSLNSINDLKKIPFGQSVPICSLLLLYWFANAVDIEGNDTMTLTFNPDNRDYGSHHYGNYEGLLDPLPRGNSYKYYTIGSLNQDRGMSLPHYVVSPPATVYGERNRDRIIVRITQPNIGMRAVQRIDQVYITQHIDNRREYDPDHTYRITANLLREIRRFSVGQNQQRLLQLSDHFGSNAAVSSIRSTWGNLAGFGLLLLIVIQGSRSFFQQSYTQGSNFTPQSYYTQQSYTPGSNFTPQSNYGRANMQNDGFVMCIILALVVVVFVFVVFGLATHGK
ncbi:uncharacterized protein LOC120827570 [Gasterosteus aculeatus]